MFFRISQNYKLLFPSNFSQRQGGHPTLFWNKHKGGFRWNLAPLATSKFGRRRQTRPRLRPRRVSRISPERINMEKLLKIYNHSHVWRKKLVYFGPQTTKLFPLIYLHNNWLFSEDLYISAPRGCCALKFLHVLEIHQGLLAHTPSGAGVPQKIIIVKIKNLA